MSKRDNNSVGAFKSRRFTAKNDYTHEELVRLLSDDERSALVELARAPLEDTAQSRHGFRFLQLGLAELSSGKLVLTAAGLTLLSVVRDT